VMADKVPELHEPVEIPRAAKVPASFRAVAHA
jgi:hypothetical protein